jgi:hypothetical protein
MTKKITNEPASDAINITKIPEPMSHEDLFKLELPKDDVRLTSSDSLAITEIDNRLTADARSKFFKLRKIAEGIEGLQEKWHFWNNAKREYKNSIDLSMSYQSASGVCSMSDPGKGKWLDALIDNELAYYREQMRVDNESNAGSEQPVNIKDTMKVVYLYQTGVLKFLEQRMGATYPDGLDKIVARIIGSSVASAKTALRKLPGQNKEDEMKKENHDAAIGLIRDLKFTMKPFTEIKFDDDELPAKKLRS